MGKRNEPINSLSVLWYYYYEVWIKDKGAFYLILFRISVLKQRLFGEVFWFVVFVITYPPSLITRPYFTMESLILAQDER